MFLLFILSLLSVVLKSNVISKAVSCDKLNCYYYNATGIRSKLVDFNSFFDANEYDIISVTETWFNDSVFDGEILVNGGYNLFRKDRTKELVPDKTDGGGVLLAVKQTLASKRRYDLETDIETMWVEVTLSNNTKLFVATCYMNYPKLEMVKKFEKSIENVASCLNPESKIIIFGDFNLPSIKWERSELGGANIINRADLCPLSSYFTEVIDSHSLEQFNTLASSPAHTTNVLDLIFCGGMSASVEYTWKAAPSTHEALHVMVDVSSEQHTSNVTRECYNFKRADWEKVHHLLNYTDWSCLNYYTDVNKATSYFYDIVFAIMKDCIPVQRISHKHYPYWYDREMISLVKSKAHFNYKKTNCNKLSPEYSLFSKLRKELK